MSLRKPYKGPFVVHCTRPAKPPEATTHHSLSSIQWNVKPQKVQKARRFDSADASGNEFFQICEPRQTVSCKAPSGDALTACYAIITITPAMIPVCACFPGLGAGNTISSPFAAACHSCSSRWELYSRSTADGPILRVFMRVVMRFGCQFAAQYSGAVTGEVRIACCQQCNPPVWCRFFLPNVFAVRTAICSGYSRNPAMWGRIRMAHGI